MIAWSIEAALESSCFERVVCSTDDEEIADIAKKYGEGLISEDIVRGIPDALKRLKNGKFIK